MCQITVSIFSEAREGSNANYYFPHEVLLSRSPLEPLISLDLVSTKLYCFRARDCLYIIFSANPVRRSEELRGDPRGSYNVSVF